VIFFFDRSVGIGFPRALREIRRFPAGIEYHQQHFSIDELDDYWLPIVGQNDWIVIGHDYSYHKRETEREAIEAHGIGVFYLWGSEAPQWESVRVFAKAYDRIVEACENTPRPFIFWVRKDGRLVSQSLS
jgi:hypothetical protein